MNNIDTFTKEEKQKMFNTIWRRMKAQNEVYDAMYKLECGKVTKVCCVGALIDEQEILEEDRKYRFSEDGYFYCYPSLRCYPAELLASLVQLNDASKSVKDLIMKLSAFASQNDLVIPDAD